MADDIHTLINHIISKMKLIDADDIPAIDLYMDQVTTFMDKHLKYSKRYPEDKILTKTMINNYAKNDLLPPPEKKKYSKEHVLILAFIYYYKNILAISDIKKLLTPLSKQYFQTEEDLDLATIYQTIATLETDRLPALQKELEEAVAVADTMFLEISGEDGDFLRLFSLISTLSFDVYVKKQMIERLIDNMELPSELSASEKKAEKKANKKESK